jgi:hypothetical protein
MSKQLTIAIDFDNTWTADCLLWLNIYTYLIEYHNVIIATGRTEFSDDMDRFYLPTEISIVYCGKELKDIACKKAGYKVDIWIDDMPETIRQPLIDNLE